MSEEDKSTEHVVDEIDEEVEQLSSKDKIQTEDENKEFHPISELKTVKELAVKKY